MKIFLNILIAQLITIPVIITLFKILNNNKISGFIAGSVFCILSLIIIFSLVKKTSFLKTFSFYGVVFHLIFAVLPIMTVRLINWSVDFKTLSIMGISGESFHQISEKIYLIMILCTVLDLLRLMIFKISLSNKIT